MSVRRPGPVPKVPARPVVRDRAVEQLDEASLYYLRTRGLDRNTARQILTRAFAQTIVDRSPIAESHDAVAAAIDERLSRLLEGESA